MGRLSLVTAKVRTLDSRIAPPVEKRADPHYSTPEHLAWREEVLKRAGRRCEWIEDGMRCEKSAPEHRLFADHKVERRDDGADLDPANGQCLCGAHHTIKTAQARAARMARP